MEQAVLHPLPPDVLDEPETVDLRPGAPIHAQSDPPVTPTPPPPR
jgi:hypothetical protein